ncbi:hypothetical protein AGLY_001891 [Aphis glycines]|uniref:Uncharacterized protein n=1 Tax=Aphis glycines TaxID=307491 RepID=A0A6G0U4P4_APHGL|nr:hypothetical protein AGLY_001891 [Aphis glycines]
MWRGCVTYVHFELHTRFSSAFNDILFEFGVSPIHIPLDNIWSSKNASIFDFSPSLKRKLNLVGTLGGQKLKIFNIFEMNREKPKENEGKTGFFFAKILFFYNSKTNRCKYLKFSPNTIEIFNFSKYFFFLNNDKIFLADQKILKIEYKVSYKLFLNSNLYEICQNCENLQVILWLENLLKIWYKILHKFFFKYLVDKIFLALSKYLKMLYKVPHMCNFFLLAFEVQILTKIRQNYEYLQIILPLKHKPPFSPTTGNYILG